MHVRDSDHPIVDRWLAGGNTRQTWADHGCERLRLPMESGRAPLDFQISLTYQFLVLLEAPFSNGLTEGDASSDGRAQHPLTG